MPPNGGNVSQKNSEHTRSSCALDSFFTKVLLCWFLVTSCTGNSSPSALRMQTEVLQSKGCYFCWACPEKQNVGRGRVSSGAGVFQATHCGEILNRSQVLDDFDPCGETSPRSCWVASWQVYPGVLALFREITAHRAAQQREKPKERDTCSCSATGSSWTEVHRTGEAIKRLTLHHPCI